MRTDTLLTKEIPQVNQVKKSSSHLPKSQGLDRCVFILKEISEHNRYFIYWKESPAGGAGWAAEHAHTSSSATAPAAGSSPQRVPYGRLSPDLLGNWSVIEELIFLKYLAHFPSATFDSHE